uniref:Uncharacterized protein n=1 Tax=Klebsiella pneumoniae TaxID=573 RepID=A0A8B0SSQ4_KLEPN|nr:hypothetical protein [Klebsiella pneumoniae]
MPKSYFPSPLQKTTHVYDSAHRPTAYFTCSRTARLLFWAGECNERFQTSVFFVNRDETKTN